MKLEIDRSDLEKTYDVVVRAYQHHHARDVSNAALHLAQTTRQSPLTSELEATRERLAALLEG